MRAPGPAGNAMPTPPPVTVRTLSPFLHEIPRTGGMRVPGRIYASVGQMRELLAHEQEALRQVANVAHLPGIVGPSLAMPEQLPLVLVDHEVRVVACHYGSSLSSSRRISSLVTASFSSSWLSCASRINSCMAASRWSWSRMMAWIELTAW